MADKLGYMFICTAPGGLYDRDKVEKALVDSGFPTTYLPGYGDPADKFRSGTSHAIKQFAKEHKKDAVGRRIKIKLTDVHVDEHVVQKDVVQEIVKAKTLQGAGVDGDLHENVIEESIAKLTWRRKFGTKVEDALVVYPKLLPDGTLDTSAWAPGIDYTILLAQLADDVKAMFNAVTDVQLRAMLRKMIADELHGRDASPVRGTFFIPADRTDELDRFRKLLSDISDGIYGQSWTLYDEGTVKKDLQSYFENDMQAEVDALIAEMNESIKAGGAKANKRTRFEQEIKRFKHAAKQYNGFVNKQRIEAMLLQAELQLNIVSEATQNSKSQREAAKARQKESEVGLAKLPKGQRVSSGPLHTPKEDPQPVAAGDVVAAQDPRNRRGLFG